jgi:hypothetical protein
MGPRRQRIQVISLARGRSMSKTDRRPRTIRTIVGVSSVLMDQRLNSAKQAGILGWPSGLRRMAVRVCII